MKLNHSIEPIYDQNSQILILGSMPSVISRQQNFYYAHPQNRFWLILENVFKEPINIKKEFLLRKHIALWDVIKSCEINGSSDASIKNVEVNDIASILAKTKIKVIFITGKKAYELYKKYLKDKLKLEVILLPSPSSANASFSLEKLIEKYQIMKNYLS